MMRRSRPTGSGGGVIVAAAAVTVALLLTAHSCSGGGGGAASLASEMSGPAAGSRCGGRLDEIGRDCPNPERINVVPLRWGRSRGLDLC